MRLFLAPMEGVVDHHLRKIYSKIGGIDAYVTEFIRVSQTTLPPKVFRRYCPELDRNPLTSPVKVQLLGNDPHLLGRNALKATQLGAPAIDLNFGCPAKTVNKSRGGACLLDETALIFQIVKTVREYVPTSIPVSAKIRLGFNDRNSYMNNALAIEAAGADEIAVHARSKADGYRPPAYWEYIKDIREALSIPVIANGEIWSVDDFKRCQEVTGCTDFMIGRGLLAKPDLALAIKAFVNQTEYTPLPWLEVVQYLYHYHLETAANYNQKHLGNRLKQWLVYLQGYYPQAKIFFEHIKKIRDMQSFEDRFKAQMELEHTA